MKIREICNITMGQSPSSVTYNENGDGLPFFQGAADFGKKFPMTRVWCSSPLKIAYAGDILISVRAPVGTMNIATSECCIGRGLAAIKVDEDACDSNYFWFALESKISELNNKGSGSTFKAISKSILEETEIPLPELEEQHKIAKILTGIENISFARQQQLAKLDELVKARFVEMFGGINESVWYPYQTIESFTSVMSGGTPDRNIPEYWQGNIRWIKTTELKNCIITDTEEKISQLGVENSSAKIIPANSILVAMYGQGKTRGMTGYITVECATNQACACILPSEKINQKYLWKYIIFSYDKLRSMAKGGNQPNLNAGIIRKFPVLMPPMNLQNRFAVFAEQVEKTKLFIQNSLKQMETLKKSLMQQYFG